MYTITFKVPNHEDVKIEASLGDNFLAVAGKANVDVDAPCSGNGTCGKCKAKLVAGTVENGGKIRISEADWDTGWRLLCQSEVCGDATLWIPSEAGNFRSNIQTADLSTPEELERYNKDINAVFDAGLSRGRSTKGVGLVVDIGTTTVTAALLDIQTGDILGRASAGNGQIIYGADVINRIIQQSKPGGTERLMEAIREDTLYPLVDELCKQAKTNPEDIACCVIAGNTTMEHLFIGENGESIRLEPYEPIFLELRGKTAADLNLPFSPQAPIIFAPNVGSYVGGDITAGALAALLWATEQMTLFVDLGTNGELVFGNRDFMLCCACSAGPAFEGGEISCGMRATNGAIESCTIDPDTMEPHFKVIGDTAPAGMCGSGLIDVVAELFRGGIISARGKLIKDGQRIRRPSNGGAASYVLAFADETATGRDVVITETDIENLIRAKGAIFSAIRAMLSALDLPKEAIENVIIAGGIGSGISIENAMDIGMLPRLPLENYTYIGNSSLTGACAMLLSSQAEEKVYNIGQNMTYLELSTHPGYMDEFIAASFIPHTDSTLFE